MEQNDKYSNQRQLVMRRIYIAASRGRDPLNPTDRKYSVRVRSEQRFEINMGGWSNALTSVGKDNLVYIAYV